MTDDEYERRRAAAAFAGEQGTWWQKEKEAEFAALPVGTLVMINVINGSYVTVETDPRRSLRECPWFHRLR